MAVRLSNNATTQLAASITAADTSIHVVTGTGSLFPALSAGDEFPITVVGADSVPEIMRVTARAGDVFTVVRAQEDTTARSFAIGSRVDLRLTAGTLLALIATLLSRTGGALTGNVVSSALIEAATLRVAGKNVWHEGNFDPGSKLGATGNQAINGDRLTVDGTDPRITLKHGGTTFSIGYLASSGKIVIGAGTDLSDPIATFTPAGGLWLKGAGDLGGYISTTASSSASSAVAAMKSEILTAIESGYIRDIRLGGAVSQSPISIPPGPGYVLTNWSGTDGYGVGTWRPVQVRRGDTWMTVGVV